MAQQSSPTSVGVFMQSAVEFETDASHPHGMWLNFHKYSDGTVGVTVESFESNSDHSVLLTAKTARKLRKFLKASA